MSGRVAQTVEGDREQAVDVGGVVGRDRCDVVDQADDRAYVTSERTMLAGWARRSQRLTGGEEHPAVVLCVCVAAIAERVDKAEVSSAIVRDEAEAASKNAEESSG
jgi:hypothetical protein